MTTLTFYQIRYSLCFSGSSVFSTMLNSVELLPKTRNPPVQAISISFIKTAKSSTIGQLWDTSNGTKGQDFVCVCVWDEQTDLYDGGADGDNRGSVHLNRLWKRPAGGQSLIWAVWARTKPSDGLSVRRSQDASSPPSSSLRVPSQLLLRLEENDVCADWPISHEFTFLRTLDRETWWGVFDSRWTLISRSCSVLCSHMKKLLCFHNKATGLNCILNW